MIQPLSHEELADTIEDTVKFLLMLTLFTSAYESMSSHLTALLDLQLERAIGPETEPYCPCTEEQLQGNAEDL